MTNLYTVHYQHTAYKRISFNVAAQDEREAWQEARKTMGLPDSEEVPPYITIAKVEPKEHPEGRERPHTDFITCPYCGYENQDSWEFVGRQEEPLEVDCGVCDRPFIVTMYVEVTYTSIPKETA